MRNGLLVAALFAFAAGGSTACATKGYVGQQVSQVSGKVDTLSQSLEETQERTRRNEARIGEVDGKAQNAQTAANRAQDSATAADAKAAAAGETARKAGDTASSAVARTEELEKDMSRIVYTVVLSEDQGGFKFNSATLPDTAKGRIDEMIKQLLEDPKGAYFEIEGHTDSSGDPMVNERLGLKRAEQVKMYLYETYQIPLHRMNTISYGETKPVAANTTSQGRAQNRRVVIRVLN